MTSTEWPQVDAMPSMVSSADLFDGDILGDELIDIYNAAVVGGGDDDGMNGKILCTSETFHLNVLTYFGKNRDSIFARWNR